MRVECRYNTKFINYFVIQIVFEIEVGWNLNEIARVLGYFEFLVHLACKKKAVGTF